MKQWLGIDANVHEAILDLQDFASIGQYYSSFRPDRLASAINTVLAELDRKHELNKRLNEENVALMRKKEA